MSPRDLLHHGEVLVSVCVCVCVCVCVWCVCVCVCEDILLSKQVGADMSFTNPSPFTSLRNWDHATRPTFQQISQLLDRDDSILSSIGEYSELVPADGLVLGSSLERAKFLHFDLQKTYDK